MLRGRLTCAALISMAAIFTAASPADHAFGRKLGKTQKIKEYGYSLRIIERWTSIPSKPGQTKIVGSWQPDQADAELRGDWSVFGCELTVVRFTSAGALTGSKEEQEKEREKREKEKRDAKKAERERAPWAKQIDPQNLEEYLEATYEGARKRCTPEKFKAGSGSRRLQGELLEFTKGSSFILCALFKEPDYEWGVFYEAPEGHYAKEWKSLYEKSLKSFRVFEPEGGPRAVASGVDMKDLPPEKKRQAIKDNIAGNPGWWAHDTDNYVFLTDSDDKNFIRQLGREIETLRAKVYEKMFPPSKQVEAICIVRVFGDESGYYQYGGPRGSAGYWDSSREELVLFNNFSNMSSSKSAKSTKSVMYHEAFHQYIYYAVGDLAPHSWFNEGHGDYFAGHKIAGGRAIVKKFDWRINTLKRHMTMGGGLIPIQSLVRLPQSEYYSNASLKYAQGWALIYYLREVAPKKEWREIPDKYFTHLRDNIAAFKKEKDAREDDSGEAVEGIPGVKVYSWDDQERVEKILSEAVDKGFEGVDYQELDELYKRWIEDL